MTANAAAHFIVWKANRRRGANFAHRAAIPTRDPIGRPLFDCRAVADAATTPPRPPDSGCSDLGGRVARDFHADAFFNDHRSRPRHSYLLWFESAENAISYDCLYNRLRARRKGRGIRDSGYASMSIDAVCGPAHVKPILKKRLGSKQAAWPPHCWL
jgi:hypothetical protein